MQFAETPGESASNGVLKATEAGGKEGIKAFQDIRGFVETNKVLIAVGLGLMILFTLK